MEGHTGSFQKENFLTKAILMNLREGVRDHARHECQGCRIGHPSQKHHDMCLWTTAEEWINDYKYHEPALECLNNYNVIEDLDEILWEHMMGSQRKSIDAIHLLTPELTIDTYKNWQYFKKNQRDMTDQRKTFWAKKLLESYKETDQSTTQEEKPTEDTTKAYIVNTDLSDDPGEHWVAVYFRDNRVIYFDSYGMSPDKDYILPFIKRNSSGWIQNTEMLQDPWSKTCGMWCIYIIHQLKRGHDLKTAIHKELKGPGEDLSQNDRDIDVWFRTNYERLIKKDTIGMTAPDILFKQRIQTCKCLHKTHCLSKKYPMYKLM